MSNKDDAFDRETMTTPSPTPPKEFDLEHECECFECSVQGLHSNAQKCAQQGYKKALEQFEGEKRKLWWAAKRKVARSGTFEKTRIEDKYETLEDYYLSLKEGAK